MRAADQQRIKIKRILIYYQELNRLKLSTGAILDLMTYVFNVQEERIIRILQQYKIEEFKDVVIPLIKCDLSLIDTYNKMLVSEAKKERYKQKN